MARSHSSSYPYGSVYENYWEDENDDFEYQFGLAYDVVKFMDTVNLELEEIDRIFFEKFGYGLLEIREEDGTVLRSIIKSSSFTEFNMNGKFNPVALETNFQFIKKPD